ncbi:MAG: universal stress protein [Oleibacter sp.]|nr:universal stress protein [Thalassolituus sp.]
MLDINHILMVIDQDIDNYAVIKRVKWLAKSLHADVTLVSNAWDSYGDKGAGIDEEVRKEIRTALITGVQQQLDDVQRQLSSDCKVIGSEVTWCKHLYEAVDNLATKDSFDLVVKGTKHHSALERIFPHSDWHLLRDCPAPVLLVRNDHSWDKNRLMAAIDVVSEDSTHERINDNILSFTEHLTDHYQTEVHMVTAFPYVNIALSMLPEVTPPEDLTSIVLERYTKAAGVWAHKYNIKPEYVYVEEGETDEVIVDKAKSIDVDLVIVGSIGREGLKAIFIGNTSERLVDKLSCDLLVIKSSDGVLPDID